MEGKKETTGSQEEEIYKEFSFAMMLISHHHWENRHHCYSIGFNKREIYFCARCLGLYPFLLGTMVLFFLGILDVSEKKSYDLMALGCGVGILDWGLVRIGFWEGNNLLRTLTGALMGVGLGIGLPHYFRHPESSQFWAVVGALGGTALLVEIVGWSLSPGKHEEKQGKDGN